MLIYGGPSPRARGKLPKQSGQCRKTRTIPTGAGKTNEQKENHHGYKDHPHGRGENSCDVVIPFQQFGPSPRARGKQPKEENLCQGPRTIPTGAGKTCQETWVYQYFEDHPHGRGENLESASTIRRKPGPSPRARGKPQKIGDKKTHHTISCDLSIVKELRLKFSKLLPI